MRRVFVCLQRRYLCWPLASREPTPKFRFCEFWLIRFAIMTQPTDRPGGDTDTGPSNLGIRAKRHCPDGGTR